MPPRGTRPTSERVREALFSALEAMLDLDGARVLDLYAGSGALGLEALSRGAGHALFVEAERRAADLLRRNAADLRLRGAEVRTGSVATVLMETPALPYDVVFADPPYALGEAELREVLGRLVERRWLAPGAVLLVERSVRSADPEWPEPLTALRSRRYGDTAVHWAEYLGPDADTAGAGNTDAGGADAGRR
ncbi:16S rRNA (guanine966-N2)-methyltransferase [Streptoalloteichus tenebrarius]|uniref:16S rRNA (Guanine966-N2)-methyltransferase n=1 Tax=Streptoalloteichus tenebrarius (strain ATCC 17920 / DSM 40477 / JCM 4838 / CBS 697.72 / NBRC 16177 / NCIMB 11028 / NRRL B-12390 / A12253. 1 / ISP 5477) TaxID=1933 RepID=A0ABT1HZI2_STRSD|nr:16S rRNA (guanine966-N2)-methyltransferase [Streptoalloteichus tenebrarius]